MTPEQIKQWLGFPADLDRELRPEIVTGMADVPAPPTGPTDEHVRVFAAFLACVGGPPSRWVLFLPSEPEVLDAVSAYPPEVDEPGPEFGEWVNGHQGQMPTPLTSNASYGKPTEPEPHDEGTTYCTDIPGGCPMHPEPDDE